MSVNSIAWLPSLWQLRNLFFASSSVWGCQHSLACGHTTQHSHLCSVLTSPSPLCVKSPLASLSGDTLDGIQGTLIIQDHFPVLKPCFNHTCQELFAI